MTAAASRVNAWAKRLYYRLSIERLPLPLFLIGAFIWATAGFVFVGLPMIALTALGSLALFAYMVWFFIPLTLLAFSLRLVAALPAVMNFAFEYTIDLVTARQEWRRRRFQGNTAEVVRD